MEENTTSQVQEETVQQKCRICGNGDDHFSCKRITHKDCTWIEPDLCSACSEALTNSNQNNNDMNFFKQLAALDNVDMTIRIMKKNEKLTLNIMPGSGSASIQPILVTGTPDELDSEFFKTITPGVKEISGIVTNMEAVKKEAAEKQQARVKAAAAEKEEKKPEKKVEKKSATKAAAKTSKKEEPVKTEEPNLFA